jgi:aminoglycoside phosphotransferase (APT) family kinase protein
VDGQVDKLAAPHIGDGVDAVGDRPISHDTLRGWVEQVTGGRVSHWQQIAGGNRYWSFAVDVADARRGKQTLYLRYQPPRPPSAEPYTVWREARFYAALRDIPIPAPKLVAVHDTHQAILTERTRGKAEFRRIKTAAERTAVATEFVEALAVLHAQPISTLALPGYVSGSGIVDCVRQELAIWRAMYEETNQFDPLIDLAVEWLEANVPSPTEPPVFVHGDAGQGNFLFEDGHLTALLDWELAHVGDPMEDLAWFSMRSVMEPVENFAGLIRHYARASGRPLDFDRIRYHRVFVSARVVIIRHRNVTGRPGNSIVSRALNRRLLIAALAEANRIALPHVPLADAPDTPQTAFFDDVIGDLAHNIAAASDQHGVVDAAKNAAKVIKYLREIDRLGTLVDAGERSALADALGAPPASVEAGKRAVFDAVRGGRLGFAEAIACFHRCVSLEAQFAAPSSGGLATRLFPPLEES